MWWWKIKRWPPRRCSSPGHVSSTKHASRQTCGLDAPAQPSVIGSQSGYAVMTDLDEGPWLEQHQISHCWWRQELQELSRLSPVAPSARRHQNWLTRHPHLPQRAHFSLWLTVFSVVPEQPPPLCPAQGATSVLECPHEYLWIRRRHISTGPEVDEVRMAEVEQSAGDGLDGRREQGKVNEGV